MIPRCKFTLWYGSEFLSFVWLNNIPLYVFSHFVYPFIYCWTDGLFPFFGYTKYVAMNIGVQGWIWERAIEIAFSSSGCLLRFWNAESYGNYKFNFLRNCPTVFLRSHTILHFYQKCTRFSISACPHQTQALLRR